MNVPNKTILNVEHVVLLFIVYVVVFLRTPIDLADAILLSGFFLLSGSSWYVSMLNKEIYEEHRLAFAMMDTLAIILGLVFIATNVGGIL